MRRFLAVIVAGFAAVLAACAGDGVPPRANSSDYPVHRDAQTATIAAALLAAIFLLDAAGEQEESGISTAVRDRVLHQKTSLLVVDALTGVEAESRALQNDPDAKFHPRCESQQTKVFGMKRNETGFWSVCK